jgi:hypothetical protein
MISSSKEGDDNEHCESYVENISQFFLGLLQNLCLFFGTESSIHVAILFVVIMSFFSFSAHLSGESLE